jgi:uncharacterized metal-binding protein YceD (DUF177 family)
MKPNQISPNAYRVADLPSKKVTRFSIRPDGNHRNNTSQLLGFEGIKKLDFTGEIAPMGKRDWRLSGKLGATVTQSCVVTLKPVTTRIDISVTREFLSEKPEPTGDEYEITEDDSIEELGEFIDAYSVMQEALAIAAPDYPRVANAQLEDSVYTEPGKIALTDEDAKPFAALANLIKQTENPEKEG